MNWKRANSFATNHEIIQVLTFNLEAPGGTQCKSHDCGEKPCETLNKGKTIWKPVRNGDKTNKTQKSSYLQKSSGRCTRMNEGLTIPLRSETKDFN